MDPILVTGATGNVGAEVLRLLQAAGADVRAAVRPESAARLAGSGAPIAPLDFARPATFGPALRGVKSLFLMRPPAISNTRQVITPFITEARIAGVERVTFLSLQGAERNRVVPHAAIEDDLRASGIAWTFLRAGFFMQNLSTTHRDDIRVHDDIFVPAGEGRTSFIDVRDIAKVAARTLTEAGHANTSYTLTGSEALSYAEVAAILSEELGRPISYPRPSLLAFARRWRQRGEKWPYIMVMAGIYTTARLGLAGGIAPETRALLGRDPITVRQFVRDHLSVWAR